LRGGGEVAAGITDHRGGVDNAVEVIGIDPIGQGGLSQGGALVVGFMYDRGGLVVADHRAEGVTSIRDAPTKWSASRWPFLEFLPESWEQSEAPLNALDMSYTILPYLHLCKATTSARQPGAPQQSSLMRCGSKLAWPLCACMGTFLWPTHVSRAGSVNCPLRTPVAHWDRRSPCGTSSWACGVPDPDGRPAHMAAGTAAVPVETPVADFSRALRQPVSPADVVYPKTVRRGLRPATAVAWHTTDTAMSDRGQERPGGGPHPTAVGVGLPCDRGRRPVLATRHFFGVHPMVTEV